LTKQVIVVVHGVGVKQAGVSSDLLAAALQADDAGDGSRFSPHSSDDYVLLENAPYDTSNKASVFPARIRRYRSYKQGGAIKHERVIADFFWGDVTAFGTGVLNVVLAYFRVAMGLSHAIRENAKEVYSRDDWKDYWCAKLARGAALMIHGPVIAINIVLLIGLVLAAAIESPVCVVARWISPAPTPYVLLCAQIVTVAVAAFAVGMIYMLRGGSFLYRHLMSWVAITGVAFLVLGTPELFGPTAFSRWLDATSTDLECKVFSIDTISYWQCQEGYTGIRLVGFRLSLLLNTAWVIVLLQVLGVWVLTLLRPVDKTKPKIPNLVAPAIGLMSLLWFFLSAALWAAALKLPDGLNLGVQKENITGALVAINAAVLVLGFLGLVALCVVRRKGELKDEAFGDPQGYMKKDETGSKAPYFADRFRLLIAPGMLRVLCLFLPLVLAISLLIYIPSAGKLLGFLVEWTIPVIFGVLAVGSFLVYRLQAEFTAGIGILADVLAYLNNSSWMSGAPKDAKDKYYVDAPSARTLMERLPFVKTKGEWTNSNPRGYWLRRRIHDRLDVLVRSLIRDEKPDRIEIVSHSQGTIIAIDLVALRGGEWFKAWKKSNEEPGKIFHGEMRLVTMGSPYTHLYGYYFPSSFKTVTGRPELQQRDPLASEGLTDWINIFRIDDFVGTYIGTDEWPREFPVPANGHTNYWVDRHVVMKLRDFLKLS
jgi:hypothetical protein